MPVVNGEDCIVYGGKILGNGYGMMYSSFSKANRNAHRVVYEEVFLEIPEKMVVMHMCDNRSCININHLMLGTQADNRNDMYSKGRGNCPHGEKHHNCKITEKNISLVFKLNKEGKKQKEIAKFFSVNQSQISRILNNKQRTNVGEIQLNNSSS